MEKKVVVIAGPSGSGKNTLIQEIRSRYPRVALLTTATTRAPRPNEVHGEDYYFYSIDDFDREVQQGHIKGTSRVSAMFRFSAECTTASTSRISRRNCRARA